MVVWAKGKHLSEPDMTIIAHADMNSMQAGLGLLVCGVPKIGNKLAIAHPDNSRSSAEVVGAVSKNLRLKINLQEYHFESWTEHDAPFLINYDGEKTKWKLVKEF